MPINYSLVDNPLTERPDDFRAITTTDIVVDEKYLVEFLAQRGNTSTTQYLAVVNEIKTAIKYFMELGYGINLPFLNVNYSLSGVFENAADSYDPARHHLNVLVNLGKELRNADLSKVSLVKLQVAPNQAIISQVLDIATKKFDTVLTPGNMLQMTGNLIKVDGDAPENGVYFVNQSTQAETKAVFTATNTPKSLILLLPSMPAGDYKVKVVTQFNGSISLKAPRTITYDKILTVA